MTLVCVRRIEMAVKVKGALGFGLSHHDVAVEAIWVCSVHNTSSEIIECTNGPQRLEQLFQSLGHLLQALILNLKYALTW
jgi:hypothetical protein